MRLAFTSARWAQDDGGFWLSLRVENPVEARRFLGTMKDKKYVADIKEYRERRSLDANALLWKLLDDMASAKSRMDNAITTKEDLYLDYVKDFGPFKDFELSEDEAKTFRVAWSRLGIGWPTEQVDYTPDGERLIIRAYYGSSQYNSKQMSRLIDAVVQDAKAIGIEVLTERELSLLKEEWKQ